MKDVKVTINYGVAKKKPTFQFWQFVLVFMSMIVLLYAIVDIYVKLKFA